MQRPLAKTFLQLLRVPKLWFWSATGVLLSMLRFGPKLALTGLQAPTLTAPFAKVVDPIVTDPWLRKFLDLECFVLRYGHCAYPSHAHH